VELHANGRKVADWQVGPDLETFNAQIPAEVLNQNGLLKLEIVSPKAVTPNALGLSLDLRTLGVQVHELTITEAE
jgi:hypothetical protein